jgi:exodeoxyribonuclease-1
LAGRDDREGRLSFVFYDTETTGTNTAFDQILQFGAIQTDAELRELDRFEIRCRLLPYVVPSPGALLVTRVSVNQLTDPALPSHYQMTRAIRAKLQQWSPATFIGHNSLGFDEHLLRQAFYKTLHTPYLTNTNGNCRSDSLRMIQAVARFAPGILQIPVDDRGKQSFKLDRLAPANGFDHSAAHDAMADVEATIHMCRLIAERTPELWANFVSHSEKAAVTDFALNEDVFALTDFYFGNAHSWMVTAIGRNPDNGSELLVFDLAQDPEEISALDDAQLTERLAKRPKLIRSMRTNACPIVLSYDEAPQDMKEGLPPIRELRARALRIKHDAALGSRLIEAVCEAREQGEFSEHVEEQIYDGFFGKSDQALMDRFHEARWPERAQIVRRMEDKRLRTLGQRLIYCDAPETMTEVLRGEYDAAITRRLMGSDGDMPWLTLPKAIEETADLLAVSTGDAAKLLRGVHCYLRSRAEEEAAAISA